MDIPDQGSRSGEAANRLIADHRAIRGAFANNARHPVNNEIPEDMTRKYVGDLIDRKHDALLFVLEEAIDECSKADRNEQLIMIAEHFHRESKLSGENISEY